MAIDWETATDKEQLEEAALWLYRLLIMVRPMITAVDGEHGKPVFEQYLCIPANGCNDRRIREIAKDWKASSLVRTLPLYMGMAEEGDAPESILVKKASDWHEWKYAVQKVEGTDDG